MSKNVISQSQRENQNLEVKNKDFFKNSDKKNLKLKIDKNLYEKSKELYLKFQLKS